MAAHRRVFGAEIVQTRHLALESLEAILVIGYTWQAMVACPASLGARKIPKKGLLGPILVVNF